MVKAFKNTLRPVVRIFRIIKNHLISTLSPILVQLLFKDIWLLKKSYLSSPSEFKKNLYYAYLEKFGAWIGINSNIITPSTMPHGFFGIFISNKATIEEGVVIFHQVTIGSNTIEGSKGFGSPHIGKNVFIGAGAKIIGGITVKSNTRIGANAVVHTNIPENSLVVMNCTKIIERETAMNNKHIPINE